MFDSWYTNKVAKTLWKNQRDHPAASSPTNLVVPLPHFSLADTMTV